MMDATLMSAEWNCAKRLLAFYQAIDDARYVEIPSFFTQDCAWTRRDTVAQGRGEIARIYEGRSAGTPSRHIVTNLTTTAMASDAVDFSLCITYYTAPRDEAIPTVPGPTMILSSFGRLQFREGLWLIHRKETVREFLIGPAPARA